MATITQPRQRALPSVAAQPVTSFDDEAFAAGDDGTVKLPSMATFKAKLSSRDGWIGSYNFGFLCMPELPFSMGGTKRRRATPFYALDQPMPILLALICGFQHALAMLGGLITPPIIFANELGFSGSTQNQMVAVSLIACGILSAVQMTRIKLPFTGGKYYIGTGLITVVGTSFATLSTASSIFTLLYADGTCPMVMMNGTLARGACPEAYGYLQVPEPSKLDPKLTMGHRLGTSALCSLIEIALAFVPPKTLKRMFPPIVTGTVILLIGASLIGDSGFPGWAGGSGPCSARPETGFFSLCPTEFSPHALPWGSPEYIGLGFLSFVTIIILEFVGSPAMKSASIVIGLIVGCIVAGPLGYIDGSSITSAPAITFLWVQTFPLKVHGPSILPMLAVYLSLTMEAIGDITASSEASRQPVDGLLFDSRIQGGILADGVNGCLSALAMNPPLSIFAQNNGVISITRCANRFAGYCCCVFLIIFGILAKISGLFLAIPAPVLGGVTTFLFATVTVSGLKVISMNQFSRRDRVILAAALSLGLGNLLVPTWSSYIFSYAGSNSALSGFLDSIIIVLSTPFLIGGLVASVLNLILPADPDSEVVENEEEDLETGSEEKDEVKA